MFATQAQFDFIKSLIASRDWTQVEDQVMTLRALALKGQMTKAQASSLIDALKACPEVSLEGIHQLADGTIYKVQVAIHGSGRPYAKRLTVCLNGSMEWEMERGAMRHLSLATRMTREQAAEFGHLYGRCAQCGRTLTDEDSIARGIGPVCAENFA